MDELTRLAELAKEKNVDVTSALIAGVPPQELITQLEQYKPPTKGFFATLVSPVRGASAGLTGIGSGIARLASAIPVVEYVAEPVAEQLEKIEESLAISPESSLPVKVGYTIGSVIPYLIGQTAIAKALGQVGTIARLAEAGKAGKIASEAIKHAPIPAFIGATTAERVYRTQPEEEKDLARTIASGAISGGLMAIPLHRLGSRVLGTAFPPETAKRIAMGIEEMPSRKGILLKEAGIGALTFPAITTGMVASEEWGRTGEISPEAIREHLKHQALPESIAGAILGGISGLRSRQLLGKEVGIHKLKELERETIQTNRPSETLLPTEEGEQKTIYDRFLVSRVPDETGTLSYAVVDTLRDDINYFKDANEVSDFIGVRSTIDKAVRVKPFATVQDTYKAIEKLPPSEQELIINDRFSVIKTRTPARTVTRANEEGKLETITIPERTEFIVNDLRNPENSTVIAGDRVEDVIRHLDQVLLKEGASVEDLMNIVIRPIGERSFGKGAVERAIPTEGWKEERYRPASEDAVRQALLEQQWINRLKETGEQFELFRRGEPLPEAIPTSTYTIITSPEGKKIPLQYNLYSETYDQYRQRVWKALVREATMAGWKGKESAIEFLLEKGFKLEGLPLEFLPKRDVSLTEPFTPREVTLYDEYGRPIGGVQREVKLETPFITKEGKRTEENPPEPTPPTRELVPFENLSKSTKTIINKINNFINYVTDKNETLLGIDVYKEGNKKIYTVKLKLPDGTETQKEFTSVTKAFSYVRDNFKKPEKKKSDIVVDEDIAKLKKRFPQFEIITFDDVISYLKENKDKMKLSDEHLDIVNNIKEVVEKRIPNEDGAQLIGYAKDERGVWVIVKYPEEIFGYFEEGNVDAVRLDKGGGIEWLQGFIKKSKKKDSAGEKKELIIPEEKSTRIAPHPRQAEIDAIKTQKLSGKEKRALIEKYNLTVVDTDRLGYVNKEGQLLLGLSKPKGFDEIYALIKEPTGEYRYKVYEGAGEEVINNIRKEFSRFDIEAILSAIDKAISEKEQASLFTMFGGRNVARATLGSLIKHEKEIHKSLVRLELASIYDTLNKFVTETGTATIGGTQGYSLEGERFSSIRKSIFERLGLRVVDSMVSNFIRDGRVPTNMPPSLMEAMSLVTKLIYKNTSLFEKLPYDKVSGLFEKFIDVMDFESIVMQDVMSLAKERKINFKTPILRLFEKTSDDLSKHIKAYSQVLDIVRDKKQLEREMAELERLEGIANNMTSKLKELRRLTNLIVDLTEAIDLYNRRTSDFVLNERRDFLFNHFLAEGKYSPEEIEAKVTEILKKEVESAKKEFKDTIASLRNKDVDFSLLSKFGKEYASIDSIDKLQDKYNEAESREKITNLIRQLLAEVSKMETETEGAVSDYIAQKEKVDLPSKSLSAINLIRDKFIDTLRELVTVEKVEGEEKVSYADILGELSAKDIEKIEESISQLKSLTYINEKGKSVKVFDNKQLDSLLSALKEINSKSKNKESEKLTKEFLRKIGEFPVSLFNVDTYKKFVTTIYNYITDKAWAEVSGKPAESFAFLNKEYLVTDEQGRKFVNIDNVFQDIRKAGDTISNRLFGIGEAYLDAPFISFKQGNKTITKTLRDIVTDKEGNYNPIATNILLSLKNYIERAIPEDSQSRFSFYEFVYDAINNPKNNLVPQLLFLPKDFTKLAKFGKTGKVTDLDGYVLITIPEMTKLNDFEIQYLNRFLRLEGKELLKERDIAEKIFTLGSISPQTNVRLLVLDAKTLVNGKFTNKAFKNALENLDNTHIVGIHRQFINGLFGYGKLGKLDALHDALQTRRLTAQHLEEYSTHISKNFIDYYAVSLIDNFINTTTLVRRIAELNPSMNMDEIMKVVNTAGKDLSLIRDYNERQEVIKAKEELGKLLSEPLGRQYDDLLTTIQKAVDEGKKKGKELIDFRILNDKAKDDPRILRDPIEFINFMKRTISRVLGENVDIVVDADHLAKILEYKYGSKIAGFALKFSDRNYLGVLLDSNRLTYEDAVTMGHELAHFIWDKLNPTDRQLLLNKYKSIEAFADAFGRYVVGKYEPPSFAKRAFDYIVELWEKIRNVFRGLGFTSSQDLFDKIYAGEYATRNPNEVPIVRLVDAWEVSRRINPDHKEHDWEIAFRKKSEEAVSLEDKIMSQAIKAVDYAKGIVTGVEGEPNIFKYLYRRAKDVLMLPVFHEHLKGIVDKYKVAQRYVVEVIMSKYEEAYNAMKLLESKNILEPLKAMVIASDAEGKYFTDIAERLKSLYPELKENELKAIINTYDMIKRYTDRVYITTHKQGFLKLASIMKGQASFEASRGNITEDQKNRIILATDKLITNLNNDFYRFYDYTIQDGERRPIDGKRRNYAQYVKEYVNELISITGDKTITDMYNKAIEGKETIGAYINALDALKEEVKFLTNNPYTDFVILASTIAKNTHLGYDLFSEVLDKGFYFPRVRGEGNYEARVFMKIPVKDEDGKIIPNKYRYVEIEYLDTDRNKFDRTQQLQRQKIVEQLKYSYKDAPIMDTIEAYAKDIPIDKALTDFVKREYKIEDINDKAPEYVIVSGRKAPKEKAILYQHTPSEIISFLGNLAIRAGNEKISNEIRDKLPQMIGQMYADINYAMARKLHRRRLPKEAIVSAVQGYKEDIIDVFNEYAIRMQGHLSNNIFLTDIMDLSYNPEFREFSIKNPQAKDLIDKQISLYLSPNTNLANAVYKMRAVTAMMYLGLRLSSALLNFMNFPMVFLPEYNDLKASGFNLYLNRYLRSVDVALGGVKDVGQPDISRIDILKKYPEAWKDLAEAVKMVERYASWKAETENILGEKTKIPVIDRMTMKINLDPVRQKLMEARQRGDKAEVEKLQRDLFILEGLNKLVNEQTIESSMYHTLRMEGMHLFGKTMNKAFDASFLPFRMTERYVRTVSSVMALNEIYNQVSRGKSFETVLDGIDNAVNVVSRMIDQTYFRYDRLNRYWWTNPSKGVGAIMSMPTTLRGFTANFLSAMFSWAERKQWDKIATSMATLFVLGGVASLPAVDDLFNQMEKLTGSPIRLKVYKALKDNLGGDDIARVITKGVPSALIDFSSSMKIEFPLLPKSWDFTGFSEMFFGVHKDLMDRWLTKAPQAMSAGDYFGAMSYLLPLGIGLPIQAYGLTTEGLRTKYGRTILDIETGQPFKLTSEEAVLRALGFRPIRLAEIQDLRYYGTKIAKKFDAWRSEIYNKLRKAEDAEDRMKVFEEIADFNRAILEYHGAIAPITSQTIRRAMSPRQDEALLISRSLLGK